MECDDDPVVIFRKNVEENLRLKYKDAIKSLERENLQLRQRSRAN
jgi:hypothetical protein